MEHIARVIKISGIIIFLMKKKTNNFVYSRGINSWNKFKKTFDVWSTLQANSEALSNEYEYFSEHVRNTMCNCAHHSK